MKHTFFMMLLLVARHVSIAQYDNANKEDTSKILNAKYFYSDLENDKKNGATVQLPFSNISFTDVRYDTSFVAINWHYPVASVFNKTYNRKYNFNGGLAANLSRYFNNYYSTSGDTSGNQLVCFIKKFSITLHYELLDHFNAGSDLFDNAANDVNLEIECYYKKDNAFYPAARVDTSYSITYAKGTSFTDAVKEILQPLMYKTEHISLDNVLKRKQYTTGEIAARYTDRFNLPALTNTTIKRGVYKTFAAFKNNAPSIDSFTISTEKLKYNASNTRLFDATSLVNKAVQKRNTAVFLYNASHELISPSDIFGYSDGATFWIQHGAFFYPLVKTGNAFEFIYIYRYADADQHTQTLSFLMPLNMETGHSN